MKNIEKMTLKETIDEFFEMMLEYIPDDDTADDNRFQELYFAITEKADIEVDIHDFTADIRVIADDLTYTTKTNVISGKFLEIRNIINGDYDYGVDAYECDGFWKIKTYLYYAFLNEFYFKCITCSLSKIQKELTDDVLLKTFKKNWMTPFRYLLANPRKDVIEWALKHKEGLGLNDTISAFIRKNQGHPELKELIFNTL